MLQYDDSTGIEQVSSLDFSEKGFKIAKLVRRVGKNDVKWAIQLRQADWDGQFHNPGLTGKSSCREIGPNG